MRVTIRDVARTAGVSISTVSRVLNATCAVSEDKRLRVEQAVADLGYTPDPNARGLQKKATGGLGVLVPSVSEEFFSQFLTGLDEVTRERGLYLLISSSHREPDAFEKSLASMYGRVDGLIIMAPGRRSFPSNVSVLGDLPLLLVNTSPRGDTPTLGIDNEAGFAELTQHMLAKGHSRLGLIKGPRGVTDAQERTRGFNRVLRSAGISADNVVSVRGDFSRESGYRAAGVMMASDLRPTAILAQNDLMALGAMSFLFEHGARVPDDVMVSGFDDVPAARYSTPGLTTVRVPIRRLGELAAQRLINLINGAAPEGGEAAERLPVDLVLRASTGD